MCYAWLYGLTNSQCHSYLDVCVLYSCIRLKGDIERSKRFICTGNILNTRKLYRVEQQRNISLQQQRKLNLNIWNENPSCQCVGANAATADQLWCGLPLAESHFRVAWIISIYVVSFLVASLWIQRVEIVLYFLCE